MLPMSADELALTRLPPEATLRGEAQIKRDVRTNNGVGGRVTTMTVVATVPAQLSQLSGSERKQNERIERPATGVISLPYGTDVTANDLLVFGGVTYEVAFVPENQDVLSILRVQVRKRSKVGG